MPFISFINRYPTMNCKLNKLKTRKKLNNTLKNVWWNFNTSLPPPCLLATCHKALCHFHFVSCCSRIPCVCWTILFLNSIRLLHMVLVFLFLFRIYISCFMPCTHFLNVHTLFSWFLLLSISSLSSCCLCNVDNIVKCVGLWIQHSFSKEFFLIVVGCCCFLFSIPFCFIVFLFSIK